LLVFFPVSRLVPISAPEVNGIIICVNRQEGKIRVYAKKDRTRLCFFTANRGLYSESRKKGEKNKITGRYG